VPGVPHLQPLDFSTGGTGMHFYASKSFFDPVGGGGGGLGRRIYWGWALVPPASTQTLPRDTRWHAALQRLTFEPIPELALLRAIPPLFSGAGVALQAGHPLWLGDWAPGAGNQSELSVEFELPTSGPTIIFGVAVLVGGGGGGGGNLSTPVAFSFDPAAFTLNVTVGANATGGGGAFAAVPLLPGDARVDVRVFVDVTFMEVFVMQGRCAFTYSISAGAATAREAGMTLYASAPMTADANAWRLGSIWVDAPTVLAAAAAKRGSADS